MHRRTVVVLPILLATALAGCGGKDARPAVVASATVPKLDAAQARPSAPAAASAVARIADIPEARRRLGFVDLERLDAQVLPRASILRTVLGAGADRVERLPAGAALDAIQVGDATVLRGPQLPAGLGAAAGADGAIVGGRADLVAQLRDTRPTESIVADRGPAVVQSCLGDSAAHTTVRVGESVPEELVAAGLRESAAIPGEQDLVICFGALRTRDLERAALEIERRYGKVRSGENRTTASVEEFGEVTILTASIPADAIPPATVRRLLSGGDALLALIRRS